jgi:hypothetical protein
MPAWATVAVTLGAAIISAAAALVGALVRGRQERALHLHDRRIEAAGDFSLSAHKASADIKDAVRSAPAAGDPANQEVLDRLHEHLHEAEAHAMLASLLFKTQPDAAQPSEVIELLREAVRDVRAVYGDEVETVADASLKPVRAKAEKADAELERSVEAVLKALEG